MDQLLHRNIRRKYLGPFKYHEFNSDFAPRIERTGTIKDVFQQGERIVLQYKAASLFDKNYSVTLVKIAQQIYTYYHIRVYFQQAVNWGAVNQLVMEILQRRSKLALSAQMKCAAYITERVATVTKYEEPTSMMAPLYFSVGEKIKGIAGDLVGAVAFLFEQYGDDFVIMHRRVSHYKLPYLEQNPNQNR